VGLRYSPLIDFQMFNLFFFYFYVPEESSIPEMSIELSMLDKLKVRVQLARKIENAQHKIKKTNHDRKWMKETAETLGVDLDSDFIRYLTSLCFPFLFSYFIDL